MQFRFISALTIFQKRINQVLEEHLDKFVIVYLDNIIIYSKIEKEYYKYIKWVL